MASRASGRGGGTTLPGRMLLRLAPDALGRLGRRLDRGTTIVSATNGKTTTAGMIAAALEADGRRPVHNRAGSNMTWGVATALLEQRGEEGLFEVDEAWLPKVAEQLDPTLLVLGNLFRDQLDRYGEMEALADDWGKTVAARTGRTRFALNADDPTIADLGRDAQRRAARRASSTSASRTPLRPCPSSSTPSMPSTAAAAATPTPTSAPSSVTSATTRARAAAPARPRPQVAATAIELRGMSGSQVTLRTPQGEMRLQLPLPGLYNVYNALAAVTAALELGVAADDDHHCPGGRCAPPSAGSRRSASAPPSSRSC